MLFITCTKASKLTFSLLIFVFSGKIPGLLDQKYTVCERCYNESGEEITLDSDSTTPV